MLKAYPTQVRLFFKQFPLDIHSQAALAAAKAYLAGMDRLMMSGCLGQLPEILDGDAPHHPRGCDAQAWSALEALRVWKGLNYT